MPVTQDKDVPGKTAIAVGSAASRVIPIALARLRPSGFSRSIYGDPAAEADDLLQSIRHHGILVPLVVAAGSEPGTWEVVSGHRRLASAMTLGLQEVPCEVRTFSSDSSRHLAVLEYNRQRRKNFTQTMREADAIEELWKNRARSRRLANLRRGQFGPVIPSECTDRRDSDDRRMPENSDRTTYKAGHEALAESGRSDEQIARRLGIGGKDLYRQARAIWQSAHSGDVRAQSGVSQLDRGTKTIHAAYKDLRRRDRFSCGFSTHTL